MSRGVHVYRWWFPSSAGSRCARQSSSGSRRTMRPPGFSTRSSPRSSATGSRTCSSAWFEMTTWTLSCGELTGRCDDGDSRLSRLAAGGGVHLDAELRPRPSAARRAPVPQPKSRTVSPGRRTAGRPERRDRAHPPRATLPGEVLLALPPLIPLGHFRLPPPTTIHLWKPGAGATSATVDRDRVSATPKGRRGGAPWTVCG